MLRDLAEGGSERSLRVFREMLSRSAELMPDILKALENPEQRPWAIFMLGFFPQHSARRALEEIVAESPLGEERYFALISLARQLHPEERLAGEAEMAGSSSPAPLPKETGYFLRLTPTIARYQEMVSAIMSGPVHSAFVLPRIIRRSFLFFILSRSRPGRIRSFGRTLVRSLRDEDWRIRMMACENLTSVSHPEALELLVLRLSDPEWQVRRSASRALGKRRDRKAVPPLIARLKMTDHLEREELVESLGKIGGEGAVKILIECFRGDENKDVRQAALFCLAEIEEKTGDDSIVKVIEEREGQEENEEVLEKIQIILKKLRNN